jgi:putative Holliday junction resolvase
LSRPAIYLAFDFGTKKIGVAVGQDLTRSARPLATVEAVDGRPDWDRISRLIEQWSPTGLVVGLPLSAGAATAASRRAGRFGQTLGNRYNLPVHWIDETLTTESANEALAGQPARSRQRRRDQVAASLILETFFYQQRPREPDHHTDG